ncbi:MAG TPA: helix-turn-helix transcriptional regulator [Allosphingosinicella sp.]
MIAGCIDKFGHGDCGACERKDACASLFAGLFGARGAFARPSAAREPRSASGGRHPLRIFLGHVAKAIETAHVKKAKPKPSPFRQAVEERIEPMLASGEVGIERVARELGLSRQTLYRRLKAEGATFEELLDGVRKRLAVRLIKEGVAVKEAAWRLGFSDPAAFSRAFKRWTGSSPSAMPR